MIGKEWQIPIFSDEEMKRRWKKIRELMELRGMDALIIAGQTGNYKAQFADIRYVSNYINWFDDEYCLFPLNSEPTLFVWSNQHAYWGEKVSSVKEFVVSKRMVRGHSYVEDIVAKVKALGLERATLGIVNMRTMLAYAYVALREQLPSAKFAEAGDILIACRMIKSNGELEFIRKAGACADKGFEAMAAAAKPGATDYDLAAECEYAMIKAGAEVGSFTLFSSKKWPDGWGFPFGGTNRKLERGDVILNEISPCYGGYHAQLCRPISLGTPPDDFMEMLKIHQGIYQLARQEFRPGGTLSEIESKAAKFGLSKRNFNRAMAGFQNIDSIFNYPMFRGELKAGMVFAIHPWTDPPEADMRSKKGHMGHLVGDTCIVTDGEAECISQLPLDVRIV